VCWTRMVLFDAERIPTLASDPAAALRAKIVELVRAQAARSEIVVTFRHLEEGWVDTPEPRREGRRRRRGGRGGRGGARGGGPGPRTRPSPRRGAGGRARSLGFAFARPRASAAGHARTPSPRGGRKSGAGRTRGRRSRFRQEAPPPAAPRARTGSRCGRIRRS